MTDKKHRTDARWRLLHLPASTDIHEKWRSDLTDKNTALTPADIYEKWLGGLIDIRRF